MKGTSTSQSNISNNDETNSTITRGVSKLTFYFNKATSMSQSKICINDTTTSTITWGVSKLTVYFNKATRERQPQHHSATVVRLAKQPHQKDKSGHNNALHNPNSPRVQLYFTAEGAPHNLEALR
jgi:hypothetical protein